MGKCRCVCVYVDVYVCVCVYVYVYMYAYIYKTQAHNNLSQVLPCDSWLYCEHLKIILKNLRYMMVISQRVCVHVFFGFSKSPRTYNS